MNNLTKKNIQKVQVTRINGTFTFGNTATAPRTRVIKDYVYTPEAKVIL